jgi:ABC-type transport system involved in multi-copper enzyme maturation permease subunit
MIKRQKMTGKKSKINPIIVKEIRGQMRGPRAFRVLTFYLLGLALLTYSLYRLTIVGVTSSSGEQIHTQSAYIGQTLFIGLALLEMIFVCFITPALTAGAISSESERRTRDMLLATPLKPASIVWGKLFASLSYILLLILAAIPLTSVIFVFGGVTLGDVIQTIILLVVTAVTYGTLGLFFSTLTHRTGLATALTYLIVLCLVGSIFSWAVADALGTPAPPHQILYLNPISALTSALVPANPSFNLRTNAPAVRLLLLMGGGSDALWSSFAHRELICRCNVAIYILATLLLYWATTRSIKSVRRQRIERAPVIKLASFSHLIKTALIMLVALGGPFLCLGTALKGCNSSVASEQIFVTSPSVHATQAVVAIKAQPIPVIQAGNIATPAPPLPLPTPTPIPLPTPTPILLPPQPPLTGTIRVNFQPASSKVPSGFLKDSGETLGSRGNGYFYGWNAATTETRDRDEVADQQYDTLNHLQKPSNPDAVWEMAVQNGPYKVTLVTGDAANFDQTNNVDIEGIQLLDPSPSRIGFDAYENVTVMVHDGKLTIRSAPGAMNAKVCFVEITPITKSIQNPGFENGFYLPEQAPPFWAEDSSSGSLLVWDNTEAHGGDHSVRIESLLPDSAYWIQTVWVESNTVYTLSGWIKTENVARGSGDIQTGANLCPKNGGECTPGLFDTNDWTYVETTFNPGDNTVIQIACQLGSSRGTTTGKMWCDDIELRHK